MCEKKIVNVGVGRESRRFWLGSRGLLRISDGARARFAVERRRRSLGFDVAPSPRRSPDHPASSSLARNSRRTRNQPSRVPPPQPHNHPKYPYMYEALYEIIRANSARAIARPREYEEKTKTLKFIRATLGNRPYLCTALVSKPAHSTTSVIM